MSRQLGFGFVGAGEIAVASAAAVRATSSASLVRVVDARADLAADLAATYGGRPAASVDELIGDPAVEAIYISTPHFLHKDLAMQAAGAGKHVFVEKPMGVRPEDAWAIVDACRENGVVCGVPFVVRYAPAYREAYRLVQSGAIGHVTGFRLTLPTGETSKETPPFWEVPVPHAMHIVWFSSQFIAATELPDDCNT